MDNPATFFFVFFAIFFAILGFGGGILTEYVNVRHMRNLAPYMKIFIWIACFFFLVACFMSLPNILGSAWILGTIAIIIFILLFKRFFNSGVVSDLLNYSSFTSASRFLQRNIPNIPNIGLNIQNVWDKLRQISTQKDVLANAAINIGRP